MNNEMLAMVLRKTLTIIGASLVAKGIIPQTALDQELIAGIAGLAMLAISVWWSKNNAKKVTEAKEL